MNERMFPIDKGEDDQRVMTIREFKNQAGIEALDFYEMVKFTTKSKIIFKVSQANMS